MNAFSDEITCFKHLGSLRWQNGKPNCPYCGCETSYKFSDEKTYKCKDCKKKYNAKIGTIFEDTKIPLKKWFVAIWLITSHKKGISSLQLSKDIGVTQKTAWFMLHRLREASETEEFKQPIGDKVEVDETYISGLERFKHNSKKNKEHKEEVLKLKLLFWVWLREKKLVKAFVMENVKSQSIQSHIAKHITWGSNIMTDEFRAYRGLKLLYVHNIVNHSEKIYVNGEVHTNTIEGFWSHLKR